MENQMANLINARLILLNSDIKGSRQHSTYLKLFRLTALKHDGLSHAGFSFLAKIADLSINPSTNNKQVNL